MTNEQISSASKAVEAFERDWNRGDWMVDNGEWASAQWDDEREDYDGANEKVTEAFSEVTDAINSIGGSDSADVSDIDAAIEHVESLLGQLRELRECADSLDGAVSSDSSEDYIAEGIIDPDDVSEQAEHVCDVWSVDGWDCTEHCDAYRVGDALYMRWMRSARGARHERDLWVLVDDEFFATEE
jgi:hypothetical protein